MVDLCWSALRAGVAQRAANQAAVLASTAYESPSAVRSASAIQTEVLAMATREAWYALTKSYAASPQSGWVVSSQLKAICETKPNCSVSPNNYQFYAVVVTITSPTKRLIPFVPKMLTINARAAIPVRVRFSDAPPAVTQNCT